MNKKTMIKKLLFFLVAWTVICSFTAYADECTGKSDLSACTGGKCCNQICKTSYQCSLDGACSQEACNGGTWSCQQANEGGNCAQSGSGDGCYPFGNGCEDRDYSCSSGHCNYASGNQHTDGDFGDPLCKDDEDKVYVKNRNYSCFGVTCSYQISDRVVSDCDDADPSTIDSCDDGACKHVTMKDPYAFSPGVSSTCVGASLPVYFQKKKPWVTDASFDFYLGDTLVRQGCSSPGGDVVWEGACGIEGINLPAGVYELKAVYDLWGKHYTTVVKSNFEITSQCSASVKCSQGQNMQTDDVTYTRTFVGNYTPTGSHYILCPNTGLRIKDISTYNSICSDGVGHSMIAPVVAWVYNENGSRIIVADNGLNAQSCHLPDVDRNSVIGPAASTDGTLLESDGGGGCSSLWGRVQNNNMEVYWFVNPGKYEVFIDWIHAWCDSPSVYLCPWLGGSWRSTLCQMGRFQTPQAAEGWVPKESFKVFVPVTNLTIRQSDDVFDPPEKTVMLSWILNNTGTAKLKVDVEKVCEDWDCELFGYTQTLHMNPGDTHTLFMNVTTERTSIDTKEIGITVSYDDDYAMACLPDNVVDALVKITIPHMF